MSREAVGALKEKAGYLQSPVDDIESFLWVMIYAIVYNSGTGGQADRRLVEDYNENRHVALERLGRLASMSIEYRQLTRDLSRSGFISKYYEEVTLLVNVWKEDCVFLQAGGKEDSQTWTLCYAAAAVGGLRVILRVADEFLLPNS